MIMHFLALSHSSARTSMKLFAQAASNGPSCQTTLASFGIGHCGIRVSQVHKRQFNTNTIGRVTHRLPIEWQLIGTRPRTFVDSDSSTHERGDIINPKEKQHQQRQKQRHSKITKTQDYQLLKRHMTTHGARMLSLKKMDLNSLWCSVQTRLFETSSTKLNLPPTRHAVTSAATECNQLDERGRKRIKIRACGELYEELARTRPMLYGSAPSQGILFDVEYYDSRELLPEVGKTRMAHATTVCLLHGAPGHYSDFASLIEYLTCRGVRVVAPNFPDYNATYEHSFRHSPRERREFLQEFLRAIQVTKIDMLIGHSSAVYTMFELLESASLRNCSKSNQIQAIKSMGLFSTPSYRLPSNMAPTPFRLFTLKLFDYPLLRPLILACLVTFVKLQGIRNRVDRNKIENLLIAASAVGYSEHDKMANRIEILREHKIPTLLVYGAKDRLINAYAFEQLEQDLAGCAPGSGITIKQYRSDGTLQEEPASSMTENGNESQLVEVCRFESGGHYTFQRYAKQVNEEVYKFLLKRVLEPLQETTRL